jgi:hypothetical protein
VFEVEPLPDRGDHGEGIRLISEQMGGNSVASRPYERSSGVVRCWPIQPFRPQVKLDDKSIDPIRLGDAEGSS